MDSASNSNAVRFDAVTKIYDDGKHAAVNAVDELSLAVRRGEIFSLVGPDGAGKTTAIRMMVGVLKPTSGKVEVLGMDMSSQRGEIKKRIGYLSQRFSLYGDLTIDENIDFFAEIHRMADFHPRKEELLAFTRLAPFRDRLAARLSGGMKQKLALACTLIHAPDVIFLDEPTTGVDPVSRRDFWKILSDLLQTGISIVVSTPYLDEAERSAHVALMDHGKILTCDPPDVIKKAFPFRILEIVTDDVRRAATVMGEMFSRDRIQMFGDRLHILVESSTEHSKMAQEKLSNAGISVRSFRTVQPSLEDVFISRVSSTPSGVV
jgi:ABC-2 type transport system ATP-binding protein